MPVHWHACSGATYMLAGMLGVWLYFMAVHWDTCSRVTYMSAGMLGAWLYFMPVRWNTCSRVTYMSAGMHGVPPDISRPIHYMYLKDIILAKIGWYTICAILAHMIIHL